MICCFSSSKRSSIGTRGVHRRTSSPLLQTLISVQTRASPEAVLPRRAWGRWACHGCWPCGCRGLREVKAPVELVIIRDGRSHSSRKPQLRLSPRAYFQRAFAAVLAISFRRLADIPSARAFPPLRPSATAAGSLPSSGVLRMTWTVLPITSAGRRSPLGPRGMFFTLVHCLAPSI